MAVGQRYLRPKLPAKLVWLNIRATHFFQYQTTAQYPLTMVLQNDFRIEQHLCWFCPWSHIHCVQFIVYLDHIIIVLVPFLKYWWQSSKSTTVPQMVRKADITTLCPCITSPMVINIEQHYQISNALAMEIPQSCTGSCNEWEFMCESLFCGTGDNKKHDGIRLHWHWR